MAAGAVIFLDTDVMKGRGLKIAYVDDPEKAFLFCKFRGQVGQVARRQLSGGVGYRGANGHPSRSDRRRTGEPWRL